MIARDLQQARGERHVQRGAALIEFALVLPILLALLVGTIYYGYVFVLDAAVTHAAKQGAQAAVAVNPAAFDGGYEAEVVARVSASVSRNLEWLPAGVPDETTSVCFPGDEGCTGCPAVAGDAACISVVLDVSGGSTPLLRQVRVPGIGAIPPLPARLNGVAQVVL